MDFFKGWHKPTVCTVVAVVIVLLIAHHVMVAKQIKGATS